MPQMLLPSMTQHTNSTAQKLKHWRRRQDEEA
jgi:hypothetical protein